MKKLVVAFLLIFSSTALTAQVKIGHIDSQKILDTMPSRKQAMTELQKFQADGFRELREMDSALQVAYTKYEAERAQYPPARDKIEQNKLVAAQQRLQERQQSLEEEIQIYSQELNKPILDRIKQAVEIVAQRKKLNYIVDESSLMYADPTLDCTMEVIAEVMKLENSAAVKP